MMGHNMSILECVESSPREVRLTIRLRYSRTSVCCHPRGSMSRLLKDRTTRIVNENADSDC